MANAKLSNVLVAFALSLGAVAQSHAQAPYPSKPVRIVVGFTAGGSTDVLARLVADELRKEWNQAVVVENRVGAGGVLAAGEVAKSAPDGHTLFVQSATHSAIAALKQPVLPFDSIKDFSWITVVASAPNVLVVKTDSPLKQLPAYIAAAKAKPGELTYASSAVGGALHFAGETFAYLAGIKLNHIPYKGAGQIVTDLIGGQINGAMASYASLAPMVRADKLRLLGITNPTRMAADAGVPTVGEALPGYSSRGWFGFLAPRGTPRTVVARLNDEINRIMKLPDVAEKLAAAGLVVVTESPEYFAEMMKAESTKYANLTREIGLKPQ